MSALNEVFLFLIETLLSLAFYLVLARLLLQWVRADFRNPLCQAVVRLTNPLIMPLRRVLPPIGKTDTASLVAVVLVAGIKIAAELGLRGALGYAGPDLWARGIAAEIARALLWTYFYAIFLYALLSMIAPSGYSPLQSLLASLCEPVLRPIRRLIPSVAGIDLSPLWACIAIQALLILLRV